MGQKCSAALKIVLKVKNFKRINKLKIVVLFTHLFCKLDSDVCGGYMGIAVQKDSIFVSS